MPHTIGHHLDKAIEAFIKVGKELGGQLTERFILKLMGIGLKIQSRRLCAYTLPVFCFLCCCAPGKLFAQQTRAALFLGNSYTYVNDLPKMIADVALTTGDTLIYDSNTPGGYTLQQHSTNATTLAMISTGAWDFVVLQEQSQLPSFPIEQVEVEVFPYTALLDSLISQANPAPRPFFYMTWGRKNGDAMTVRSGRRYAPIQVWMTCCGNGMRSWPPITRPFVSPAGAVWRYIRETDPTIELYSADESHPSVAGTFATACAFYSVMFRKDPCLLLMMPGWIRFWPVPSELQLLRWYLTVLITGM